MTSGPSYKQLAFAGLLVGATAVGAYIYYTRHAGNVKVNQEADAPSEALNAKTAKKAKKSKKKASKSSSQDSVEMNPSSEKHVSTKSEAGTATSATPSMMELAALCEKDIEELLVLKAEDKQNVFYALLLRGELLMSQPGEDAIMKSVSYFAKAIALVPNPSEIMAAFEKTLPKPIFSALISTLQGEVVKKTEKYFETLTKATGGKVAFAIEAYVDQLGNPGRRFMPKAKVDIAAGETVFEEVPDVVIMDPACDDTGKCDHDYKQIEEGVALGCEKFGDAKYCSEGCKKAGFEYYHMYTCEARGPDVTKHVDELRDHCKTTGNPVPFLMLHYVSMLLTEEIRGNGSAMNGPFAHYDHLPQAFPEPSDEDRKEAALIRAVFTSANENLADFLTDTIYASMKATLTHACFSFALDNPEAIVDAPSKPFRKLFGSNQEPTVIGLYHLAAHLPHACDASLQAEVVGGTKVRFVATRAVKAGEPLSLSFLPLDGMQKEMRREKLFLTYMLNCECTLCKSE